MKIRRERILAIALTCAMGVQTVSSAMPVYAADEGIVTEQSVVEEVVTEPEASPTPETPEQPEVPVEEVVDENIVSDIGDTLVDGTETTIGENSDDSDANVDDINVETDAKQTEEIATLALQPANETKETEAASEVKTHSIQTVTYSVSDGSVSGMYSMDSVVATEQADGTYIVRMHQTSENRNVMAFTSDKKVATKHEVDWYQADSGFNFTIPVTSLEIPIIACFSTTDRIAAGNTFGNAMRITFDTSTMTETTEKEALDSAIKRLPASNAPTVVAVTEVTLGLSEVSLTVGDTKTLTATVKPDNASNKSVTWTSSDDSVATVVDGLITAVKSGSTTITAKAGEKDAVCKVNVSEKAPGVDETPTTEQPKDGTYDTKVESSSTKFNVIDCVITSKSGQMTATVTLSGTGYDYLYAGTSKQAVADRSNWAHFVKDINGKYTYTIPVSALDVPLDIAAHSINKNVWYDRQLTFYSEGMQQFIDEGDYTVDVSTGASMFKVVACKLTSKNKTMTAVITLSGTGYSKLFMGTPEEAAKADESEFIPFVEDANGKYTYTIPVSCLDQPISVASYSIKNQKWYDRELTFDSSTIQRVATGNQGGSTGDNNGGTTGGTTGGNTNENKPSTENKPTADTKPDNESKHEADLSGSTGSVNNTTTLKDGVYTPDGFSFSGGTGKVSITCNKITVKGGQAFATIVFGSSAYGYVKVNGSKYYGTVSGDTTTFVIPVALNQNTTIIGMTTKMSAAHEITYNIYVSLAAAANGNGASTATSGVTNYNKLDEEAPQIMGLEYKEEVALNHAEHFKIFQYDQGISLLEIDMTKDTLIEKEDEEVTAAKTAQDAAAKLYQQKVVKYLVVPENVEIPAGLDKEMIVIQLPADKIYVTSKDVKDIMKQLEVDESNILELDEKKDTKKEEADEIDYKELVKKKCNLAILSSKDYLPMETRKDGKVTKTPSEKEIKEMTEKLKDVTDHFATLKVPVIIDRSQDEKTEEAKAEWEKVYELLLGDRGSNEKE